MAKKKTKKNAPKKDDRPLDKITVKELKDSFAEGNDPEAGFLLYIKYEQGLGVKQNVTTALIWMKRAAEAGLAEARNSYGYELISGENIPKDVNLAREHWEQAAEKGHADAFFNLGVMFGNDEGVDVDETKAREYFEQAAGKGHAGALFSLGMMYFHGEGTEVDKGKACEYFEQAAEKGDTESLFNLGVIYDNGDDVEVDNTRAREYFEQAAEKGHAGALLNLGVMYNNGDGVEVEKDKAREYYEQAAEKGDAGALFNLGVIYDEGDSVNVNKIKAREYFEQAAEQDYDWALSRLGLIYIEGDGVEIDKARAREYWKRAAQQGHTGTMFNLGLMYSQGFGVEVDKLKAREYYEQAAEKDHAAALYNLGWLYYEGDSLEVDKSKAREYWGRASQANDNEILFRLGQMYASGIGLQIDKIRARKLWIRSGYGEGYPRSLNALAELCFFGDGVRSNIPRANCFWSKSLESEEDADVLFHLGIASICEVTSETSEEKKQECHEKTEDCWRKAAGMQHLGGMILLGIMGAEGLASHNEIGSPSMWHDLTRPHRPVAHIQQVLREIKSAPDWKRLQIGAWLVLLERRSRGVLEELSRDDPDVQTVSHYSPFELLRNILPSKPRKDGRASSRLRIGSTLHVNDPTEGRELARFSEAESQRIAEERLAADNQGEKPNKDEHIPVLHEFFPDSWDGDEHEGHFDEWVYCVCFCELADRLDAWRLYGDDGRGSCIEIPVDGIFHLPRSSKDYILAKQQSIFPEGESNKRSRSPVSQPEEKSELPTLHKVRYSSEDKRRMLDAIRVPLEKLLELRKSLDKNDKAGQAKLDQCVHLALLNVLYLFKNVEYENEREYRVLKIRDLDSKDICLGEPGDEKRCRLYIEMEPFLFKKPILKDGTQGDGFRIVLGPKLDNPREKRVEIERRLRERCFNDATTVEISKQPYR